MNGPKLRVAILGLNYAPEPTGNAPYTASLAEGLVAAGHSVQVLTGFPHYPEWRLKAGYTGWTRNESINGVSVRRLRHFIPKRPNSAARMLMEISFGVRLLFASWSRPDVVLVVSPALFSSGLALLRCRLSPNRAPVAVWVQDIYSRGVIETAAGSGRVASLMKALEGRILRSATAVVAIHERFRYFMVNSMDVPPEKVRVIRNWTHLPPSPPFGQAEMRVKLGWKEDDIVVLHAGNMGKKQGLENIINAARLAEERKSPVRFVLMGDGNQRKTLEAQSAGLLRLDFVDPLPGQEFQLALAAADVLLVNELPGVRDMAVPSKLTSYFNAGVPVIAATDTRSVTASEIEASGGGLRIDAADPESLVDAAVMLGANPTLAADLGSRGLRFRNDTLSEETALAHYDDLLSDLASRRNR